MGEVFGHQQLGSLPSYSKYADSGIGWAGVIPDCWETTPIKFVARLESGHTPSRQRPEYWFDCTIPWFGLADGWCKARQSAS